MPRSVLSVLPIVLLGGFGCGGREGGSDHASGIPIVDGGAADAPSEGSGDADAAEGDAADSACTPSSTSTLAGVSIRFPVQPSTFTVAEAARTISFTYEIVVAADVLEVISDDQGSCQLPGTTGLILHEVISGSGQRFCACDQGRCTQAEPAVTVHASTYQRTMSWDGKNWNGPSDTATPEGAPFPPGTYTLTADARGTASGQPFDVSAQFCITLAPDPVIDAQAGGPCGSSQCAADEVCVQWACGGGPQMGCAPLDDAGGCPIGWSIDPSCGVAAGCMPPPCKDPPPSCSKAPQGCTSHDCTCFGAAVCGGSDRCGAASATYVQCGNP
jgi:hypothetical protein